MIPRYPKDLASIVHSHLGAKSTVPLNVVTTLLEVLYFASLRSEEAERISCRVAYINRNNPDPNPPKQIVKDRWKHFPFGVEVPFDVRNLVKLSKAVDPWVSTLAVDANSAGTLGIWGVIDQSVHYSRYVVNESDTGSEMPGIFQAVIEG